MRIKVKDILDILKDQNPNATVDFYHYDQSFAEAHPDKLRVIETDQHVDVYITE